MSDSSRAAYIWIAILGLTLAVVGVILDFVNGWEVVGFNLLMLGFAVEIFSISLLLYSKV